MKSAAVCIDKPINQKRQTGRSGDYARRLFLKRLEALRHGELVIREGERQHVFGRCDEVFSKTVTITVNDPVSYSRFVTQGALGGGHAYIQGEWSCDDLTGMVELFLCNRQYIEKTGALTRWFVIKPFHLAQRLLHRNTIKGSRRNIGAHYDLGNDLFEQFLDPTMMYSCAIFPHAQATLQEASETKLAHICDKLQLKPGDSVLEIGTGWGGFALFAAKNYGCQVTTTTISKRQYEYTQQRVREAGLEDRINLLFEDYRNLDGRFDKLVSIEMIEAIGHRYFDTYFNKCSELLKPSGMMLLQSITIGDQRYRVARKSIDFIQRYIFPGGCLPSVAALSDSIARKTNMRIYDLEDIGIHYAATLRLWRERFFANIERVRQLGYSEDFIRMWDYYLSYCEGGFRQQTIGTVQLLLTKPRARRAALVGAAV